MPEAIIPSVPPPTRRRWRPTAVGYACAGFLLVPLVLFAYKIFWLDYRMGELLPTTQYRVNFEMSLDGHSQRVRLRTFSPMNDAHQIMSGEESHADEAFRFSTDTEGSNRSVSWESASAPEQARIRYSFSVLTKTLEYELDRGLLVPESYPESIAKELRPTDNIQVDHPEVRARLHELKADEGTLSERLQKIFEFTAGLGTRPFKGMTDAVTALRLGEASCNGKSRLFAALARASGIPARLVGGLLLSVGDKRTSHQWVEAYIGGHWVPFDVTNRHFARLPAQHLVLYRGDEALFSHTADINFNWSFSTSSKLVPSPRVRETFRAFNVWSLFDRLNLPFSLLKTVLMLPLGALIVVFFRNVVGVPTFGTFLPALLAAAAAETGPFWGLVSVLIVSGAVVLARMAIQHLRLLHSPTLAILLAVVVMTMLGTSFVAEHLGLEQLARTSYFPVAVMAIASERLYLTLVEQGSEPALKHFAGTLLVVLACYTVMNSLAMQVLVGGFPEVLLLIVAANIYLGRWVGVRVFELFRFRGLLRAEGAR